MNLDTKFRSEDLRISRKNSVTNVEPLALRRETNDVIHLEMVVVDDDGGGIVMPN